APIAYGIAGLYKPELQPPHLMDKKVTDTRLQETLKETIQSFAANDPKQDEWITPGFKVTTNALFRIQIAGATRDLQSFELLTCDSVAKSNVEWNGAAIDRYCYVRARSRTRSTILSFWLTSNAKVAGIGSYSY